MIPPDEPFEKLLSAYFEGGLDAAGQQELDDWIIASATARRIFWQRASLEGALESWGAKSRGESMAHPKLAAVARRRKIPWAMASGWAAAAVLTVAWILNSHGNGKAAPITVSQEPVDKRPISATTSDTPVAYLSRVIGVSGAGRLLSGQTLASGREVVIGEGLLELDFYSGARVSIQGPARFLPESDMRLRVTEGVVQVDVPDSAKGFMLALPDGVVTDFGTSFGVEVANQKTSRLQVSRGEIELAGTRDGAAAKRLHQGDAVSLAGSGGSQPISYQPLTVITSIDRRSAADNVQRAAAWDKISSGLDADPSLLVHFRFLADEEGRREILNRATAPGVPRTGTVIASEWSRGRWNGKPALSFHNPADRVRLDIPGEYSEATFLAWVKTDGLPRRYNGLFFSEFGIPGEAHWQISPDGRFLFGVRPKEVLEIGHFHRAFSEPVLALADFGTWRLLATSYNSRTREVVHYVDGAEVHRSLVDDGVPLQFGRATLGNFFDPVPSEHMSRPDLGDEWIFRNWSGAVDEFMLFSRALNAAEISHLHRAGRVE